MHAYVTDPLGPKCLKCGKGRNSHKYNTTVYTYGFRGVACPDDACGKPLRLARTPARDFVIGENSLFWRKDRCRHCGTPYQFRRTLDAKVEFRLIDDNESGRVPEVKYGPRENALTIQL